MTDKAGNPSPLRCYRTAGGYTEVMCLPDGTVRITGAMPDLAETLGYSIAFEIDGDQPAVVLRDDEGEEQICVPVKECAP